MPATADGRWPASDARGVRPRVSRRAAPTLSSKSALAPRPTGPTYLGGEGPRYGGRGGPSLRPRVQGGAVRWTFKVPPWTRYLGKVPWHGGTWHVDLAFTIDGARCRAVTSVTVTRHGSPGRHCRGSGCAGRHGQRAFSKARSGARPGQCRGLLRTGNFQSGQVRSGILLGRSLRP